MVFAAKSAATKTVRRVRLRSTMCVPPWEAGVKPSPPKPVSRPECMRTSATRAIETSTCQTAITWSMRRMYQRVAGGLFRGDAQDHVDQLGCDPVLRHVRG